MTTKDVKNELGFAVGVKKAAHETFRVEYPDGRVAIRYHHTDVITTHQNGDITLDSGGWRTPITKARINAYLSHGWKVYQKDGVWYLKKAKKTFRFLDGITIHSNDKVFIKSL